MSKDSVKTQIDIDITNKTTSKSISPLTVGNNMKAVVDLIPNEQYKIYIAKLTHDVAPNPPNSYVLKNTIGNITVQYIGVGEYRLVSTGLFPSAKSFVIVSSSDLMKSGAVIFNSDYIRVLTENDGFQNLHIEIIVYN